MKCPQCGYDNAEDALSCNLCQFVLRREKAAPAPAATAAAPAEPVALDSAQAVSDLIVCALGKVKAENYPEAERIMARLFAEVDRETCRQLLVAAFGAWSQTTKRPSAEIVVAAAAIDQLGGVIASGNLAAAQGLAAAVIPTVAETTVEGFRLTLLLLGVTGAAKRGVKTFAGPPPGAGAPSPAPGPQAPPPGGANKASW